MKHSIKKFLSAATAVALLLWSVPAVLTADDSVPDGGVLSPELPASDLPPDLPPEEPLLSAAMTGTEDFSWYDADPTATVFTIATADQLAGLALIVNEGEDDFIGDTVSLTSDIDLTAYQGGAGWTPVGNSACAFKGTFRGNGHTVRGLVINDSANGYKGLFGYIDGGAVENLRLQDAQITGSVQTGGIAGEVVNSGVISGCVVSGSISGTSNAGGIAGRGFGILACAVTADVSGTTNVGGIAGTAKGTVQSSYSTGAVSASNTTGRAGGIAGYLNGGGIDSCAALNFSVTGGTGSSGRISGFAASTLQNNFAWDAMPVNGTAVSGGTGTDMNGTPLSGGAWRAASAWTDSAGLSWSASQWSISGSRMPLPSVFGGLTEDMPSHIPSTPSAPTNVAALAGDGQAEVSFTPPSGSVTGYTVTSSPGGLTETGTSSPITVTGLTNGTAYTFTVQAANAMGQGAASAPSSPVTPKAAQTAPGAPTLLSKTASSITLDTIAGAEYSKNGTDWQTSPAFTGLTPHTGYTFYARLAETATYSASPSSPESAAFTTDKAVLSGAVTLSGLPVFGETLTAVTSSLTTDPAGGALGTLSYQWERNGTVLPGVTSSGCTLVQEDIGTVITVTVTAQNCIGAGISASSPPIAKAPASIPAIVVVGKTADSVTLSPNSGLQFFCKTENTPPSISDGGWQASNVFTGLTPNTAYYFFAYRTETDTAAASPVSLGVAAVTEKPALTGTVSITGTEKFDEILTAGLSGAAGTFTYTWFRSGDSTAVQTGGATYRTVEDDIGKTITVQVTEPNYSGSVSAVTGVIARADGPAAPTGGTVDDAADTFGFTAVSGYPSPALYEYSIDNGASWQTVTGNPIPVGDVAIPAGGLQVRLKESAARLAGAILSSTAPFTANLTGSVSISGAPVFGETLTAAAAGTPPGAALVYEWYRSGVSAPVHTGETYIPTQEDIGNPLYVKVTAAGYGSELESPPTPPVAKAAQAPPALAYTRSGDYETEGVTVTITSPASGAVYSFDGNAYGTSNTHTFNPGTSGAAIYARLSETATHLQSPAASLTLDFTKENQPAPTVALSAAAGETSVTLTISAGGGQSGNYAYRIGGGDYTNLPPDGRVALTTPGETVTVLVHDKGGVYYNQSPDASRTITLPKYLNSATVTLSAANFTRTASSITMSAAPAASNGGAMEYSFDGGAYTALDTGRLPVFSGLAAGSSHTVAVRVKGDAQREHGVPKAVTVQTVSSGSPTGGGTGGGTSPAPAAPSPTVPGRPVNQPIPIPVPLTAASGGSGSAAVIVPDSSITNALAAAQTQGGIAVQLNVTVPPGTAGLTTALSQNALYSLANAGASLAVNGPSASVTFDSSTLGGLSGLGGGLSLGMAPAPSLFGGAAQAIGTRPAVDLTLTGTVNGRSTQVTSLGGSAALAIPYTPAPGEAPGGLYGVYADSQGNAIPLGSSVYDANSGCLLLTTDHLSVYGVGYKAPPVKFADISSHWAKDSIDFATARGLLSGTSNTTFSPDAAISRGALAAALGRLAGADTSLYTSGSFADVKAGDTDAPYIEWAYKKGIMQSTGTGRFSPGQAVTREESALILSNYAKITGYTLPVTREDAAYTDASGIGSAYGAAVKSLQQAGVLMGGSGGRFNPKASATRAEVSAMLHRYVKLTVNPAAAQGWAVNDAGQRLYYKDGKALTGWQTLKGKKYFLDAAGILQTGWKKDAAGRWYFLSTDGALVGWWDIGNSSSRNRYYFDADAVRVSGGWRQLGGKWYYFNADGALAVRTVIGGYTVDENGVRK